MLSSESETIVGCGKTVLVSSMVETLQLRSKERETLRRPDAICYYYCSFQDRVRNTFDDFLRSSIAMLCSRYDNYSLLEDLRTRCNDESPSEGPNSAQLQDLMLKMIDLGCLIQETYLFIDALDEMPGAEQAELFHLLELLQDKETPSIHMLVCSRREPAITDAFRLWNPVGFDNDGLNDDIRHYIRSTVDGHRRLNKQPAETLQLIEHILSNKSGGM